MPANPTARTLGDFAVALIVFAVGFWLTLEVCRWLLSFRNDP